MGCGAAKVEYEMDEDNEANDGSENEDSEIYRMLLLGAGESGKSTFVKQVQFIYKGGIPESEIPLYIRSLRTNALEMMQAYVQGAEDIGLTSDDPEVPKMCERIMDVSAGDIIAGEASLSFEVANDISYLWATPYIQASFDRRHEFWHLDMAPYYFENIHRIAEEDFSPSEDDFLMARVLTTGKKAVAFEEGGIWFEVVDVGGQRSERRKWHKAYDDVKALMFNVSLAGYRQVLFEDGKTNRLHESLALFGEVSQNPLFFETPVYLILNKKDLFEESIREQDLSCCFPEYSGGRDVVECLKYIEGKFKKQLEESCPGKEFSTHIITARNRRSMQIAFDDIKSSLTQWYEKRK